MLSNQSTTQNPPADDPAIDVERLGKCYHIYNRPSDRLKQMLIRTGKQFFREFWALREVSFRVRKGEAVGIIGRNGSGKSTILQIICGTLSPTEGGVATNGKIAALLELGAGFNPEFSGIENVYLAASLYGLTKEQTDQRLGSIVAFADIGDHLDQPVKTYSSGMYVRLAFAVIAHVDADILVIDEALAVGDAVFTQKCMRFIRQFKNRGTLLFVSHDMNSVLSLCDKAVWLHEGRLVQQGTARSVAEAYLKFTLQEVYGDTAKLGATCTEEVDSTQTDTQPNTIDYGSQVSIASNLNEANGWKSGAGEIISVSLALLNGVTHATLKGGELVRLTIKARVYQDFAQPILGFLFRDRLGQDLFGENSLPFTDLNPLKVSAGEKIECEFVFRLPMLPNGQYVVMASLANGDLHNNIQHHWLHDALVITVSSSRVRWGLVGIPFENVTMRKTA